MVDSILNKNIVEQISQFVLRAINQIEDKSIEEQSNGQLIAICIVYGERDSGKYRHIQAGLENSLGKSLKHNKYFQYPDPMSENGLDNGFVLIKSNHMVVNLEYATGNHSKVALGLGKSIAEISKINKNRVLIIRNADRGRFECLQTLLNVCEDNGLIPILTCERGSYLFYKTKNYQTILVKCPSLKDKERTNAELKGYNFETLYDKKLKSLVYETIKSLKKRSPKIATIRKHADASIEFNKISRKC